MKFLNQKFRQLNQTTDVLAFPLLNMEERAKFIDPPDNILRLGDIVISYPQVIEEASNEETFIDDKIDELILHGLDHLLGINLD